jgi:hypothetical protein
MIRCVQDAANKDIQLTNILKNRRANSPSVEVIKLFKMIASTEVQSKPAIITQPIISQPSKGISPI